MAYAKFREIKSSRYGEFPLPFIGIGKSYPSSKFLTPQICLLTLFVKISEFTVWEKAKDKGQHAPLCKLISGFVTCSQEPLENRC